jgi:hypothetical protein
MIVWLNELVWSWSLWNMDTVEPGYNDSAFNDNLLVMYIFTIPDFL